MVSCMSFIICNGKSDTEPSPPKDDQNGKITIDNPPVTTEEPVTPSPPNSDTGRDVGETNLHRISMVLR